MPIEIDQSNKIERTEKDTILALSNNEQRAIVIPARIKREVINGAGKIKKAWGGLRRTTWPTFPEWLPGGSTQVTRPQEH